MSFDGQYLAVAEKYDNWLIQQRKELAAFYMCCRNYDLLQKEGLLARDGKKKISVQNQNLWIPFHHRHDCRHLNDDAQCVVLHAALHSRDADAQSYRARTKQQVQ